MITNPKLHTAVKIIENAWTDYLNRKNIEFEEMVIFHMNIRQLAALEIQRIWRGYRIRRVLQEELFSVVIKWPGPQNHQTVKLAGTFTAPPWFEQITMEYCQIRKCYTCPLLRDAKEYEFKFIIDNKWVCSPQLPIVKSSNGSWNNHVDVHPHPIFAHNIPRFPWPTSRKCDYYNTILDNSLYSSYKEDDELNLINKDINSSDCVIAVPQYTYQEYPDGFTETDEGSNSLSNYYVKPMNYSLWETMPMNSPSWVGKAYASRSSHDSLLTNKWRDMVSTSVEDSTNMPYLLSNMSEIENESNEVPSNNLYRTHNIIVIPSDYDNINANKLNEISLNENEPKSTSIKDDSNNNLFNNSDLLKNKNLKTDFPNESNQKDYGDNSYECLTMMSSNFLSPDYNHENRDPFKYDLIPLKGLDGSTPSSVEASAMTSPYSICSSDSKYQNSLDFYNFSPISHHLDEAAPNISENISGETMFETDDEYRRRLEDSGMLHRLNRGLSFQKEEETEIQNIKTVDSDDTSSVGSSSLEDHPIFFRKSNTIGDFSILGKINERKQTNELVRSDRMSIGSYNPPDRKIKRQFQNSVNGFSIIVEGAESAFIGESDLCWYLQQNSSNMKGVLEPSRSVTSRFEINLKNSSRLGGLVNEKDRKIRIGNYDAFSTSFNNNVVLSRSVSQPSLGVSSVHSALNWLTSPSNHISGSRCYNTVTASCDTQDNCLCR